MYGTEVAVAVQRIIVSDADADADANPAAAATVAVRLPEVDANSRCR